MGWKRYLIIAALVLVGIPAWTLFCWEWWRMCAEWLNGHGVYEGFSYIVSGIAGIASWFIAMFAAAWELESRWRRE